MNIKMNQKNLKRICQWIIFSILYISTTVLRTSYFAEAEESVVILQSIAKDENICLFIGGVGEFESITGQIGREAVEIVSSSTDISSHTIILLDNSLSVTKDSMVKVKEILKQYTEKKSANEKISLAIYGTDIQYLVEKESDGAKVIDALDHVVNEDKDTYLTDVLYDELQKLSNKTEYTRFIVITDGVDNKAIGYTKEELSDYLKDNPYPVYSIGCTYKNNEEQLKNLFALSRLTRAGYYLLDDYNEYGEIIDSLCSPVTCVEIKVPDELKDGSTRNILLTFEGKESKVEISEELPMPFRLREEEIVPEPVETPVVEATPEAEKTPEPAKEPVEEVPEQEPEPEIDIISIGAIAVIVVALIGLVIMSLKKKGKGRDKKGYRNKKEKAEKVEKVEKVEKTSAEDMDRTVMAEPVADSGATVFLNDRDKAKYIIVLRDTRDSSKVFRYPLSGKVVVGRKYGDGVNIVLNYERTISAKHCEIGMQGEKFYVRDLHSSNGTFVNGTRVNEYMEFSSGSNIRLGNLNMTVEIEQARQ